MSVYRAAVIGLGRMGSTFDDEMAQGGTLFRPYCHGPTYYYSPSVELVAAADPHDEQRSLFGERWHVPAEHMYSDYKTMLANEQLDIVSVSTIPRFHSTMVQDAAQAGVKAIWAEKPMALSLEEADAMVRTCREEGVALAINCARRWNPYYTDARNMIEAGVLGNILQITAHAACGLSGNGSHLLDIVRYLAGGEVEWVFGDMESDEAAAGDGEITGNGYLAFDNGVRGFVRTMSCGDVGSWMIEVIGEKGRIRCAESPTQFELLRLGTEEPYGHGFRSPSTKLRAPQPVSYPIPLPPKVEGMGFTILEDLISAMQTGDSPKCSGEDGRAALEIAIAMRESHRRGGFRVSLPLEDRTLRISSGAQPNDHLPKRVLGRMRATP